MSGQEPSALSKIGSLNFAFMLKTYSRDYDFATRLLETFGKFNKSGLHLFLVCPSSDRSIFEKFETERISIVDEESVPGERFLGEAHGLPAGYLNQQIVKLGFWELQLASNYLCLDSDAYFIRNIQIRDYMVDLETPYQVLVEDKDLQSDTHYRERYWVHREKALDKISEKVGFHPTKRKTCHGLQILNAQVLDSFKRNFLEEEGLSYKDLIETAPYEFSWYNFWLQKARPIEIHCCEPFFKVFHTKLQYRRALSEGVSEASLAHSYSGVVINSNWSRKYGLLSLENQESRSRSRLRRMLLN